MAPNDQPVQQLETFGVIALKQAVMQRNSNGVEAGPVQERNVVTRNIVLAVLPPECGRSFRPKEFQHQGADLTRRLRTILEQPHVTLWHKPISQIGCPNKKRFTGGVNDLFVVGVSELRASGNQRQQNER